MSDTIGAFTGEYRFLSNFYPAPVVLDSQVYPTVEHAYQAAKTCSTEERDRIKRCPRPGDAKRIGRQVTLRNDWNRVRLSIMLDLLRQKFREASLRCKLLQTGHLELIEGNYWGGDPFWGTCEGVGENHLGRLLMQVRQETEPECGDGEWPHMRCCMPKGHSGQHSDPGIPCHTGHQAEQEKP